MASIDPNGKPENYVVIINDGSEPAELTAVLTDLSSFKGNIQIVAPSSLASTPLPDSASFTPLDSTSLQRVLGGLKGKIDRNDRLVVMIQGTSGYIPQSSPLKTCINIKKGECYSIDQFDTAIRQLNYGSLLVAADTSYLSDSFGQYASHNSADKRFQRRNFYDFSDPFTYTIALNNIGYLLESSLFPQDMPYYLAELSSNDPVRLKGVLSMLLPRNNPSLESDAQALVKSLTTILQDSDAAISSNIRGLAVEKLGRMGKVASSALPEIEKLIGLNDPHDKKNYMRATALTAFSEIIYANPQALPTERRKALLDQVKEKLNSESPTMQTTAVKAYAMLAFAWNDRDSIEIFKGIFSDSSKSTVIRRAAIEALSYADENRFLEINISIILNSKDETITYKALEDLDHYLDKHARNREQIFSSHPTLFTPLTDRLMVLLDENLSKDGDTRLLVVSILSWMGTRASKALPKLAKAAKEDSHLQVKHQADLAFKIITHLLKEQESVPKAK